jgi:cyclic beta-1,2-glucan synthetase
MKAPWNIALGLYQNEKTAAAVLRKMKKAGFRRAALVNRGHYGNLLIKETHWPYEYWLICGAVVAILLLVSHFSLLSPWILYSSWAIFTLLILCWRWGTHYYHRVDPQILGEFKKLVISDETLVIAQIDDANVAKALSILRHVESGHPTSFLLRPEEYDPLEKVTIIKEPLTADTLAEHAKEIASSLKEVGYHKRRKVNLLKNLSHCEKSLIKIRQQVSEAEFVEQTITLAAEWLLDNAYVIQGNIEEVQRNLPAKFYRELPRLLKGPMAGFPRVYALAKDMVYYTAHRLDRENIIAYLNSYQSVDALTIGELWVLPLMLRLRLVECLNYLSLDIERRLREGEYACFWGNRLLNVSRREPERLNEFLKELELEVKNPSPHFAEELFDHLYDEEKIIPLIKTWLESKFKQDLHEVIKEEQLRKTAEQISLSNAIVSLITLSQISWREIFEKVSPIDLILSKDPQGVYSRMDFDSRDKYRHEIEMLARGSLHKEGEIAARVLQMAEHGQDEVTAHVGYYLIDRGRPAVEKIIHYTPKGIHALRCFMLKHPTAVFLGGIALLTLGIEWGLAYLMQHSQATIGQKLLFLLLALLPASELAIQIVSMIITKILQPFILPKYDYDKGVPEELKTVVVIPSLLTTEEDINEDIQQLEIHYLANAEKALMFGIFYDYTDAPQEKMPNDQTLLAAAVKGMQSLEDKYGKGKFFLFLRNRVWSKSENAWIGRERKRGKLQCLNRYLAAGSCTELILQLGDKDLLRGVKYVITLDADTMLPKDTARRLVETISHPLNAPRLGANGKIARGYTIIQPRVGTDITNTQNTWFSQIFADPLSVNPYTQAVSDIYQDLMSEGNYHGKGIYDVQSFYQILNDCFPEEHVLSHDLIEGVHVSTGFASDIALLDKFPHDYFAWSRRQHRWMRGDWQIADWIFSKVPCSEDRTKIPNPLSVINRWKVFDNLRRSAMPISILLLLISAFLWSSNPLFWSFFVLLVYFIPPLCLAFFNTLISLKNVIHSWKDISLQLLRSVINIALLPQQAYLASDAILRVLFRRFISHKKLLEWEKFHVASSESKHQIFILKMLGVSFFSVILFILTAIYHPAALFAASPYYLLWFFAPAILAVIDKPRMIELADLLSKENRLFLRHIARKTWRYFDDFVGASSNWLPPDNYQAALNVQVAQRTSPTNIGLWMLSLLAANDFKYINTDQVIDRLLATFQSFKKLEMFEGHFLNWYDIQTLKPLYPRYVSTVDSGNLLACFWTLEQGLDELINDNLLPVTLVEGLKDTLNVVWHQSSQEDKSKLQGLQILFSKDYPQVVELIEGIRQSQQILQEFLTSLQKKDDRHYWFQKLDEQLLAWETIAQRYFAWMDILKGISSEDLLSIDAQGLTWRDQIFRENFSLKGLGTSEIPVSLRYFLDALKNKSNESPSLRIVYNKLSESIHTAQWFAGEKLGLVHEIISDLNGLCDGLNMRFLYNQERKLFSIGYHVDDCRLDTSYYDLLASEARIASFVAIAKDDVPLDHWWALGRPFGYLYDRHVLMSWGGTMFEYLMPLLFKNIYPGSLMTEACRNAVACQITYAASRGIPWGISESAYSAIDSHRIYQYRSFGVPGLGFKRDLEEDLVVSPYSTALALAIDPKAAIENFKHLMDDGHHLLNDYGYFEAVDFTRQRAPHGERGVIVYAYMAHHQGMTLLSFDNTLNHNILRRRFHSNPRIIGMESLLYERAPVTPPIAKGSRKTVPISRLAPFPTTPIMGVVDTPHSASPKVNLLSNGGYSVMTTNSGGGYSSWKDIEINRWRADVTSDNWGSFFYIKDVQSEDFWSATFHPTCRQGKKYSASFKADRTEYRRTDFQIETHLEIVVSPEDDAEVRLLTLANLSKTARHIELTSYVELSLAPHSTDAAHPCFNKMFIETEALQDLSGLLAFRRLRGPEDHPIFAGHVVTAHEPSTQAIQFETDRGLFIGRGRTLTEPLAMERSLTNSQGYVLDPIFSLRYRIKLEPGQRFQISFITVISDQKEKTLGLIKKYGDMASSHRAIEMAWAHAQLELRHLRIHQEEVQLFQKLASRVLYPHAQLRPAPERLIRNRRGQSNLWAYGISGDLPIVVVSVADVHEVDLVKQVLTAHVFWRMRGLKTDLVILNEESTGYEHPLFEQLQRLLQTFSTQIEIGRSGGVYLLNSDQIPEEDIILLLSVARANLIAARGSLRQQLVAPMEATTYPARLVHNPRAEEFPSAPLPFVELKFFNEIGGFSVDGREYMIYLGAHIQTPAPWVNVIANAEFGTLVSEAGLGSAWYGNSQTNRLTPWSNDPVVNPLSDIVYIRDDASGTYWTPTPGPIRELDPYRVRHGQGYTRFEHNSHGIEQDLTIFVPVDDKGGLPLRIQKLRLKNSTNVKRQLSVYAYTEWVLGVDHEKTQMHVITEWDAESQALFAFNRYNADYSNHLAFACSIPLTLSYTGNRTEFLGRNGNVANPIAMKRKKLAGLAGAAYDPCAVLQVQVELEPNGEQEVVFILGYAKDEESARKQIIACREKEWVHHMYLGTIAWWDKILGTLFVQTPDIGIDFAFNRWLLYQSLSCRFWGRTAFYQSSGAYGFRDQLQDALSLVYAAPQLARKQILLAASRQFLEGDVQHWWHPPVNGGVRTRISDDLLWLPFVAAQYIRVTKDFSILHEEIPFIKGELLKEDQQEAYFVPEVTEEKANLLDHCRRALRKGLTEGPHGLPLIGGGDWNDGMNLVGIHGKGESVWLAWFLIHVMNDFADLLAWNGQPGSDEGFRAQAKRLAEVVDEAAWDGQWYRRAYFDDGTPLGSHRNAECTIDSLSQSWSVISQAGKPEKIQKALKALEEHLIKVQEKLVLLLTPPFDKSSLEPGYIKGYPPGVRENGAQYTHGSLWVPLAFAMLGEGDKAVDLMRMMHPIAHSSTQDGMQHFRVEPYVLAADIYALQGQMGRGGWTWYTGSAAWMYRIYLEEIFGFKLRGESLILQPVLPKAWNQVTLYYRHHTSRYDILIENAPELRAGNIKIEMDGVLLEGEEIHLENDGKVHQVKVKLK